MIFAASISGVEWLRVHVLENFVGESDLIILVGFVGTISICHFWPESHGVQAVTSSQLSYFFKTHAVLHNLSSGAVKKLFTVPSPNTFPSLIWVNLERIKHHDKAGRPAIGRIRLRRKLLCQLEVVLDGSRH